MYRRLLLMVLGIVMLFAVGCAAGETATEDEAVDENGAMVDETEDEAVMPTKDNPMVVNADAGLIYVYAEVNRKWVTEPTRHLVVAAEGSNGENSIFRSGGNALEFNEALFSLGADAGENVKKDSPAGTLVEGDEFDVTVSWDGEEWYPIEDLVLTSGELADSGFTWKFGGNYEFQDETQTGCLLCLDSCAAGIMSNAEIGWQSFGSGRVEFRGDGDRLPADGTPVVIAFALMF